MGAGYLVPHLAAISDHIGHAGVHDDVTGHVQVRDALHNTYSLILAELFALRDFDKFQSVSRIFSNGWDIPYLRVDLDLGAICNKTLKFHENMRIIVRF
jgi:hypothetical protein